MGLRFLIGLILTVGMGLSVGWMLLLAFRLVGKPPGQDPKYDAAAAYWSGSFKVFGVLGILCVIFQVILLMAGL
jgi:hypothetical protein